MNASQMILNARNMTSARDLNLSSQIRQIRSFLRPDLERLAKERPGSDRDLPDLEIDSLLPLLVPTAEPGSSASSTPATINAPETIILLAQPLFTKRTRSQDVDTSSKRRHAPQMPFNEHELMTQSPKSAEPTAETVGNASDKLEASTPLFNSIAGGGLTASAGRSKFEVGITLQTHISVPSVCRDAAALPSLQPGARLNAASSVTPIDSPIPSESPTQQTLLEEINANGKRARSDSLSDPELPTHTRRKLSEVDTVNNTVAPVVCPSAGKGKAKMTKDEVEAMYLDIEAAEKQQREEAAPDLETLRRQADEDLARRCQSAADAEYAQQLASEEGTESRELEFEEERLATQVLSDMYSRIGFTRLFRVFGTILDRQAYDHVRSLPFEAHITFLLEGLSALAVDPSSRDAFRWIMGQLVARGQLNSNSHINIPM